MGSVIFHVALIWRPHVAQPVDGQVCEIRLGDLAAVGQVGAIRRELRAAVVAEPVACPAKLLSIGRDSHVDWWGHCGQMPRTQLERANPVVVSVGRAGACHGANRPLVQRPPAKWRCCVQKPLGAVGRPILGAKPERDAASQSSKPHAPEEV